METNATQNLTMTLAQAASVVEGIVIRNNGWRFRIGRRDEGLLEQVDGVSLTWNEMGAAWRFVFNLRRNGEWHKSEVTFPSTVDPADEEDYSIFDVVQTKAFELIDIAVAKAFPKLIAREKKEREEEERARHE